MRTRTTFLLVTTLMAAALAMTLAACSPAAEEPAAEAPAGGMGMGGGGEGGMVFGVVAAEGDAWLTFGPDTDRAGVVVVEKLLAPADGWVVVRSTADESVLGYAHVAEGESEDVEVPLEWADGPAVTVSLHADMGVRGTFEFDPDRVERSADRVILVRRQPVTQPLTLSSYGVLAPSYTSSLLIGDQPGVTDSVYVPYARTPDDGGWISIRLVEDGRPTEVIGYESRGAHESFEFTVPIDGTRLTDELAVTLHADQGERGVFEYDSDDPFGSPDRPFLTAGDVVVEIIRVR